MRLEKLVRTLTSVKESGSGFDELPPAFWDPSIFSRDFHRALVRFHFSAAAYVPQDCLDLDLYTDMVKQNLDAYDLLPQEYRGHALKRLIHEKPTIAVKAWQKFSEAWDYIPENLRRQSLKQRIIEAEVYYEMTEILTQGNNYLDYELCILAVKQDTFNIEDLEIIPFQHRTREVCRRFIETHDDYLEDLPIALRFDEIRVEMAIAGRADVSEVPEQFKTREFYKEIALAGNIKISEVPHEYRTREIYKSAEFDSLEEIPPTYRSAELCMKAVRENGVDIKFVPEEHLRNEIVLEAAKSNRRSLEYIPEKYQVREVFVTALGSDPLSAAWVPEWMYESEEFKAAAAKLIGKIREIPENRLSENLRLALVSAEVRLFSEMPLESHTEMLCDLAFTHTDFYLATIPENLRSKQACLSAVRHRGRSLRLVPTQFLYDDDSRELCITAIKNNPRAILFVPADHPQYVEIRTFATQIGNEQNINIDDFLNRNMPWRPQI